MTGRAGHGPALLRRLIVAAAGLALLAGCGAPSWTYVTNSGDRTYLKVPTSWKQVSPAQLEQELGVKSAASSEGGLWIQAYDAAADPTSRHVLGNTASDSPAIIVLVRAMEPEERGSLSLDFIRDLFNPVSQSARQAMQFSGQSAGSDGFTLLLDEVMTPGDGIRGVHTIYSLRPTGGAPEIFDQIGYLNDDASKLYMAIARCSADCFKERQTEITDAVASFTVREGP